jgi:hypothetical protein
VTDAQGRGWGAGWPNCQSDKIVPLSVNGTGFPAGVRRELHDLAALLLAETEQRGYKLHDGWCWGFACRPVTGTTSVPSNHSWGLALDINAPENSRGGTSHTFSAKNAALFKKYGFGWGGDYTLSPKDWMHVEFLGTPAQCAKYTKEARNDFSAKPAYRVGGKTYGKLSKAMRQLRGTVKGAGIGVRRRISVVKKNRHDRKRHGGHHH